MTHSSDQDPNRHSSVQGTAPAPETPQSRSRRDVLKIGAGLGVGIGLGAFVPLLPRTVLADGVVEYALRAGKADVPILRPPFPKTRLWCYNAQTPGPQIRLTQGETVRIKVENKLDEGTTVHWHGVRVPLNMDGVPYLTQPPIEPGETFTYEFAPPDAGTYWYHSHANSSVQIGRGLYGTFIVDEKEPIKVDRDFTLVLDDWRIDDASQIKDDFLNHRDFARAGRLGNVITWNGKVGGEFNVRAGERIRLRIVNACNARIMNLRFQDHEPTVIAMDGQPLTPFQPRDGSILLAPAQRADVVVDMSGKPGDRFGIIDTFSPQSPYRVMEMRYTAETPLRENPLDASVALPANPIPVPDMSDPQVEEVLLNGGDLGRIDGAKVGSEQLGMTEMFAMGKMWAINGISSFTPVSPPIISIPQGRTCVMKYKNRTTWPHPMHLHGHSFKVIEHKGIRDLEGMTLDTVLLNPEEEATVAFVADNPGDWLFHCHILGHADAGMMSVVRVT